MEEREGAPLPSGSALSSSSRPWPPSPSLPFPTLSPPGSHFPAKAHIPPVLVIVSGYKQGWRRARATWASLGSTSDGEQRGGTSPRRQQDVLPAYPAIPSWAAGDPKPRVPLYTSHLLRTPSSREAEEGTKRGLRVALEPCHLRHASPACAVAVCPSRHPSPKGGRGEGRGPRAAVCFTTDGAGVGRRGRETPGSWQRDLVVSR